ncbi:MAG TPA: glycosyltransferase family 4 protein [Candidatus Limnocylindrales bacterium]|nr:glycosyltransferase family 4 protein [Candidatus Limnocylindrales bacterium]
MTNEDKIAEMGGQEVRSRDKSYASGRSQTKVDLLRRSKAKANLAQVLRLPASRLASPVPKVALLTGGGDKPYALGLVDALTSVGLSVDFVGSDDVDAPALHDNPRVNFLNLRGDQRTDARAIAKAFRVLRYYLRLIGYAATAKPQIFHILWNNKFELFDRTVLMLYYRLLGKKTVLTVHNVNISKRDGADSWFSRWTLKFQYRMCHHIFVHTAKMREELVSEFRVRDGKVDVIPFGLNRTVPDTALTTLEARQRLGLTRDDKVLLFFGNIAPYKGLELLIEAFEAASKTDKNLRLVVAGRPKGSEDYWSGLLEKINRSTARGKMILKIEFVPDAETEVYFKAAQVLVLPYTHIYQSGVLLLGYGFGLPVIAADVGSLKEEIIEDKTGFVFKAKDPLALAKAIQTFFSSDLFKNLEEHRHEIQQYANECYSWAKVAAITTKAYSNLLQN